MIFFLKNKYSVIAVEVECVQFVLFRSVIHLKELTMSNSGKNI